MSLTVQFLGAAGTVTGSRFLVSDGAHQILVDCGLFQGHKVLRRRNRAALPVEARSLDAIVLTHGHLDHSGFTPALINRAYRGPVHCSHATADLCGVLWPDSGYLQEEDARYANRKGFSKHKPALPIYTQREAISALERLQPIGWDDPVQVGAFRFRLLRAGHILGAAMVLLEHPRGRLLFSGDLGRDDDLIMAAPTPLPDCDLAVMESTYGDRLHGNADPAVALRDICRPVLENGGSVLVPAFAVGRSQALIQLLAKLIEADELPRVPVYLNSPMATRVTELYRKHMSEHRLSMEDCARWDRYVTYVSSVEQSKAVVADRKPKVVVSASGMASGGRVLHHLKAMAPSPRCAIVLVGYQAGGTRGAALRDGAEHVRIHGRDIPVRASVHSLDMLSAHADQQGLRHWVGANPPGQVWLVHGEPEAADVLRRRLEDDGLDAEVADYLETIRL